MATRGSLWKATALLSAAIVAFTTLTPVASYASSMSGAGIEDPDISFAVIGGTPLVEGDAVTIEELASRGLSSAQLSDVSVLETPLPEQGLSAVPLAAGPYDIISAWTAGDGKSVILRRQAHDKIVTKHNLTTAVVKRTTVSYTGRFQEGAGSTVFHYTTPVSEIQCNGLGCWVAKMLTVEAVVDYRSLGAGKLTYGVVTTYCVGVSGACPSWVKNAVNV